MPCKDITGTGADGTDRANYCGTSLKDCSLPVL